MSFFSKFKKNDKEKSRTENKGINAKRVTEVGQSVMNGVYCEALDVFTCGVGLYAVMCPIPIKDASKAAIMEIVNLNGRDFCRELEDNDFVSSSKTGSEILNDYCFLAKNDMVVQMKADKRRANGEANPKGLETMNLKADAQPIQDIEEELGCPLLKHQYAREALFVHKKGFIEEIDLF